MSINLPNALITGGVFNLKQNIDQREIHRVAIDRLQESVAPAAFHNSGERFDPPKCHPNTRVAVRDKIERWALRMDPDTRDASILWLSGAAGAGKSAIAQTVAEDFQSKGLLIASFFFGRSDPTRNHARSLVATIVYQLYSILPPPDQSRILDVIDRDPLIFTKSLLVQFEALIVNPLQPLVEYGFWTRRSAPRLVIIDGLDECLDREMQRNVLRMLSASVRQFHSPIIFLLASRPEHDIQTVFGSPDFLHIHTRLFLDDKYLPDNDIELFLRDQFAECRTSHPFKQMIPPNWPSDEIVKKLTRKSSGQFIYASVVAKYVKSSRHWPHHRLDVVLNVRPASRDLPFSELDALYTHIFSCVEDIKRALDVISFELIFPGFTGIDEIESILRLDVGEAPILLCDLASVMGYEESTILLNNNRRNALRLKILHASLVDYLLDSARSKEYFVNTAEYRAKHIANCFQFLSSVPIHDPCQIFYYTARSAMFCFEQQFPSLDQTEHLYNAIKGVSISQLYNSVFSMDLKPKDASSFLRQLTYDFLPSLFKFLEKSDSQQYLELYQRHQSDYDLYLQDYFKGWAPNDSASLFLALVSIYRKLPIGAFDLPFRLDNIGHFINPSSATFLLGPAIIHNPGSLEYLSDFLCDQKRSQTFWAGPRLFARAAKYCLLYLCDHTAFAQKAPPPVSGHQRMRRKNTPWRWHRRVPRQDVRGPRETPWLWLRRPNRPFQASLTPCVLHRKTNDLIYIHRPRIQVKVSITSGNKFDPVVEYRIHSEKYYLVLTYLNHFLPMAGKLDDLVDMCQRLTFASRCQDFPRESARARTNMQRYAAEYA